MPPKRKTTHDDSDVLLESSPTNLNKRSREEPGSGVFDTEEAVRRSSRVGRGSGGQLAQVKNLERLQIARPPRSKRLNDLETATEGYDVNPMAPSQPSTAQAPSSKPRPKPRLKTRTGDSVSVSGTPVPSTAIQPSFSLAAPGGQFGFRLPEVGSHRTLDSSSTSSTVLSNEGSIFSAHSRASTAPTSRANSVCSSSQGDHDTIRHARGHSSHLKRLAHASQSGVEAPRRISRVPEGVMHQPPTPRFNQRSLQPESQEDRRPSLSSLSVQSQEPAVPPRRDEDSSAPPPSPPPHPIGLRRTASFYHVPLDRSRVSGHTLLATPGNDEDTDLLIDETTPSEDERFAESVLRGGNANPHPSQGRVSYDDDVLMDDTSPSNDEPRLESFPRRERARARNQSITSDHSNAERSVEVPSQNSSYLSDYTADIVPARQRRTDRQSKAPNPSGSDGQGPTNSHAEDMPTRRRRTYGRSEVHDPERSDEDLSNGNDQGLTSIHPEEHRRQTHEQSEAHDPSDIDFPSHINDHGAVNSQAEDVVLTHRRRNRAPRLPSSSQLASIRDQQYSGHRSATRPPPTPSQSSGTVDKAQSVARSSISPQPLGTVDSQVAPVGPATGGAEPWQIQFYKPVVQDMLERAKQFSHCDAASINAFPLRGHFNSLAVEYVEEAINERRSRGLPVSDGWWPHYTTEICRLLWEDLGNWRSALRKKARVYVTQRYKWDPENRHEENSIIAKRLLGGQGEFLRDGVDEDGHTNNLAHPALAGLIIDFFYTGPSSLASLFPEVFSAEVPRVTVAIAATAVKVILDEMVSSQGEVSFRVNMYMPIYLEILGLMKKCDTSAVHAEKTKALRVQWAQRGGNSMAERETVAAASTGFDVSLD